MATKKASVKKTSTTSAKKVAPKRPAATATKVRTVSAVEAVERPTSPRRSTALNSSVLNIVLAELVGTFILTVVALMTAAEVVPLAVGLTLALLVMAIGGVSGSHVNPAVTFGLWVAGKVKAQLVPFYWGAQFLGAMAAVVVINLVAGSKLGLDFSHFATFNWTIFMIEFVGTAVFLFGLVSVFKRTDLSNTAKALGIGLSLMAGILVSGTLYTAARQTAITNYQTEASKSQDASKMPEIPHTLFVKGATLNPAVALATTESTESELKQSSATDGEKHYSRLGWEVILSTLGGAALGALVARLLTYRFSE